MIVSQLRCHPVTSIPVERAVLRHIVRDLDRNVGADATVVEPGPVAAGDPVEPV